MLPTTDDSLAGCEVIEDKGEEFKQTLGSQVATVSVDWPSSNATRIHGASPVLQALLQHPEFPQSEIEKVSFVQRYFVS